MTSKSHATVRRASALLGHIYRLRVAHEMAVHVEFRLQVVIITVPRDELHLLRRLPMALPLINKPVVDLLLIEAGRLC